MQKLWGKILAEEVAHPDSYSIRALNTLRILKKSEAEKFSNLCSLLLRNIPNTFQIVLIDLQYLLNKFNIDSSDIIYLEEIGLIQNSFLSYPQGIFLQNSVNKSIFIYGDKVFLYESENLHTIFMEVSYLTLTHLGRELLKLVTPIYHDDYIPIMKKCLVDNLSKKIKLLS